MEQKFQNYMLRAENLLLVLLLLLNACRIPHVLRQTGCHQRFWAIRHPMKVSLALKTTRQVINELPEYIQHPALDTFITGGLYDAFRHLYWSAKLSAVIGQRRASRLLEAHEKDNYLFFLRGKNEHGSRPDSMQCVMDRLNNLLGLDIGKNRSPDSLAFYSIQTIMSGKAYILSLNRHGQYLDCRERIIDKKMYKGKWYIPVCLKNSR